MSENPVFNMLFLMHDILPLRNLFSRVKWNSQIIIIIMARHATKGSKGSKGGAVVRALASHQCGPVSNPGVDAICGLSYCGFSPFLREVFLRVLRFSPLPTPPNSKSIWKARTRFNEFVRTPKCAPLVSKLQKKTHKKR